MLTLDALLAAQVRNQGDRLAIIDDSERRTYRAFADDVVTLAGALAAHGVAPGDRVAAMLTGGLPMITLVFAAARLGAIVVAINWRLAPAEIAYVLGHSTPRLGLVSPRFLDAWRETGTTIPPIITPEAGQADATFDAFLAAGAPPRARTPDRGHDPLVILYTSGTTGRPKGCVLGQQGQVTAAVAGAAWHRLSPDDRTFVGVPLFHVAGLGLSLATVAAGGAIVYAARDAQAADVQGLLADTGCTVAALPPTLLGPMLKLQMTAPRPWALGRVVVGGGMARETDLQNIRAALRVDTIGGYGQTEAGNFLAWLSGAEQTERPTSCGRVLPHLEARIVDGDGHALPPDQVGHLQVRGPSVMVGYWNDPDATATTVDAEGWLSTGDLMRLDSAGFLHFAGRLKELIKSGGENVYPLEVEQVLNAHPAVQDSCVFGVADRQWGEAVHAALVLRPGATLDADEIGAWCVERIAGYKRPRTITFVDAVPRDPNGKPLRRVLSARASETQP